MCCAEAKIEISFHKGFLCLTVYKKRERLHASSITFVYVMTPSR